MLLKYFCIKDLCLRVKDNHRKNLQASNCAKECQLNWGKSRQIMTNLSNILKEPTVKAQYTSFTLTIYLTINKFFFLILTRLIFGRFFYICGNLENVNEKGFSSFLPFTDWRNPTILVYILTQKTWRITRKHMQNVYNKIFLVMIGTTFKRTSIRKKVEILKVKNIFRNFISNK